MYGGNFNGFNGAEVVNCDTSYLVNVTMEDLMVANEKSKIKLAEIKKEIMNKENF